MHPEAVGFTVYGIWLYDVMAVSVGFFSLLRCMKPKHAMNHDNEKTTMFVRAGDKE